MSFALITGASGGIGLAMAEELAKQKVNLLLVSRSANLLQEISKKISEQYGVEAHWLSVDLSVVDSHVTVLDWVAKNKWPVNILINNAGYGLWNAVEATPLASLDNMMQLNMGSLVNLCHTFIPLLKKQPQAYILNIASTASYQAVPYLSTYAATKSFVVLFSRGLKWELKNTNISVTCVSPGATSTGFIDRAGMDLLKEKAEKLSMSPESVAKSAIKGMFDKKAEVIPGFVNWISVKLTYLLPKALIEKIALQLYRK